MSKSFVSIKGKKKVIKLRNGESIMDGNSVQTPFLAPYRITKNKETGDLEPLTYVEYTWTAIENGVEIQRGLNVNGHGKLGVPTLKDKEVLRALQDIYIWNKIDKGILRLETDPSKVTEEDLIIDFHSIDNIATAMGYKKISGQQRQSIKDSIERLVATTVFNTHKGGLYDPVKKRYITDSKISYKYLDGLEDYVQYDCDSCEYITHCRGNTNNCINEEKQKTNVTKIKMSMFLYLSIANNYRLYYNKDRANEIKNLIAKNIYLISRKWIGDGYISKANIKKYIDRIPMNAKQEKHRKQAIKEGIALLDKYDFVKASIKNDIITVVHLDKKPTNKEINNLIADNLPTGDTTYLKNKYNSFSELREELLNIGLTELEFNCIVDQNIEQIEYIKALLRYVMIKSRYNSDLNPSEYFVNCWNKHIELDKKYFNSYD